MIVFQAHVRLDSGEVQFLDRLSQDPRFAWSPDCELQFAILFADFVHGEPLLKLAVAVVVQQRSFLSEGRGAAKADWGEGGEATVLLLKRGFRVRFPDLRPSYSQGI